VFVPEPTQRLLGIATVETAKAATVQKTIRLIGQVIPDPNKSGVVQSLLAGRIESPEGGFPAIGATVKKGEVLGYLVPAVAVVDQSDIAQTQGDLDKQIALLEAKLKRIEPLSGAAVPAGQITDTKIELEILRKRRAVIKPVLRDREDLRAPADGVLAQANVTAGQVVEAQSVLFQIVDPANLWIEALAFDAASADRIAQSGKDALAQTADGRKVTVSFAGRSPSLRQQAVPLRFQIKRDGPALNVGESVTVHAAIDEPVEAITLPRASVVRSSNGQPVVWAHVEAERFEARVVKTSPIDAERLGITAGIDPGMRIVTRGAELINQVR
jgi:RND family efflux transporter MFP subunit